VGYFEDAIMNCKPGDLAIIVSSSSSENIGRIVGVLRPAIRGIDFHKDAADVVTWWVRSVRPLKVTDYVSKEKYGHKYERPYQDRLLRPVSGLPVTDEVTEDLKEPA
jgi:hypothetical protein